MVEKFLLKVGPAYRMVTSKIINQMPIQEAITLVVSCVEEQRRQLLNDAIRGDKFYYGKKIVDSLDKSIKKFEERFPQIKDTVKELVFGRTILN